MIYYFDSSAIVKLYVDEVGSGMVRQLWAGAGEIAVSRITYAEVMAALSRRRREGALSQREFANFADSFRSAWLSLLRLDITSHLEPFIDRLAARHPLRGADAIHLASALHLLETKDEFAFVCADQRLLEAARQEELHVLCPA